MKPSAVFIALIGFITAAVSAPFPPASIRTFDAVKREYICSGDIAPQIHGFDPVQGEYVRHAPTTTGSTISTTNDETLVDLGAARCGQEGLRKCTRQRQGSVCENGKWKLVHRCASGQQCDMKDGNFCCRTRGPGFNC